MKKMRDHDILSLQIESNKRRMGRQLANDVFEVPPNNSLCGKGHGGPSVVVFAFFVE